MELLIVAVVGLLVIAAAAALSPRLRIADPLILVLLGTAVSFLPVFPGIEIDPEWILAGVLPPLLYSASVSMPTMNFRREFAAISGLSIVLVVISAVLLGLFFAWVIPDLGLWWGIALGAIVSPTDAVATSIVKRVGVSGRVVSVLEGESLLNDATALVLLRAAIAGAAVSVSLWGVLGDFAVAVAVAAVIGFIIGKLNVWVRSKVTDSTVNTVISFTVPFLASIPASLLGGSGLVAAVVAGLVTGHGAARHLPPQHRLSDSQNWHTVEMVLEGAIFLVMGLQLSGIVAEVQAEHAGVGRALLVAAGALVITILVRAGFIAPLLVGLRRRARRSATFKTQLGAIQERMSDPRLTDESARLEALGQTQEVQRAIGRGPREDRGPGRQPGRSVERPPRRPAGRGQTPNGQPAWRMPSPERIEQGLTRIRRALADIDYLLAAPLGWREGGILVWAGMRGAVTLAAAQTLPINTPDRPLVILIAFAVAAASLLLQGLTLGPVVARLTPATTTDDVAENKERGEVLTLLTSVEEEYDAAPGDVDEAGNTSMGDVALAGPVDPARIDPDPVQRRSKKRALGIIAAQRAALLDARDDGIFSAEVLNAALATLDADQISIELKGGPPEL